MTDARYTSTCQDIANTITSCIDKPAYTTDTEIPGMPSVAQLAIAYFEETGGACGVIALLYRGKLYTAGMGDCRVIAVWKREEWEMECMFADHNGFNPDEVKRVQDEHPNDPEAMVPMGDKGPMYHRLKGGLLPTRALGDVSYNRTQAQRDRYVYSHGTANGRIARELLTEAVYPKLEMTDAPYLSWTPDVAVRDAKDLRFLILSTDGRKSW